MQTNIIIEPFRIKMTESIRLTTREERQQLLKEVNHVHNRSSYFHTWALNIAIACVS